MSFKNKTVLITGASEGIGRATAKAFAEKGAHLILMARNIDRLESLKHELSQTQTQVQTFKLDVSDIDQLESVFASPLNFDIAINNAGIEGSISEIQKLKTSDFDSVFNTNVRGLWKCMQEEVRHFRVKKKPGVIVNLSSILGFMGVPGSCLYAASKHAVIGLTRSVAVEQIRYGIRVNCVNPGATNTNMLKRIAGDHLDDLIQGQPTKSLSQPSDVAKAILWLSSDDSSQVNGIDLTIDNGKTVLLN